MLLKVPAFADMAERQPIPIPDPQHTPHEGVNGSTGIPPTLHERAYPPPESQERQPLSGAWDLLEHRVKVYTPDPNRGFAERMRQKRAVNRWMEGLKKKGKDHDRLIIDLYTSVTVQPGRYERSERELTLGEFGYPFNAGQLEYECHYSTMHGTPVTGGRGFEV